MMIDEMYLQRCTQFQGGEYLGPDEKEQLYRGMVIS